MTNIGFVIAKIETINDKLNTLEELVSDIRFDLQELDYLKSMLEKSEDI
ncbi:hypothetical protein [Heyndrickxia ginsengihumi]|nr:hypothetical protein [Heyndrickxia ginsengihumi]